jgi:predicted acylesterase/phospholipase RssA
LVNRFNLIQPRKRINRISFSGVGGKGPYQVGVWRAMEELGLAKDIFAVSGTSVGALNAALFAQKV